MTPEQAKKLLPIVEALAEGKEVQYLTAEHRWDKWTPDELPPRYIYRVKPEPIECWIVIDKNGAREFYSAKPSSAEYYDKKWPSYAPIGQYVWWRPMKATDYKAYRLFSAGGLCSGWDLEAGRAG